MSAGLAQQVAGLIGTGPARAAQLQERIGPQWELIEGAIKANDQDAYLRLGDSLAVLGSAVRKMTRPGLSKELPT